MAKANITQYSSTPSSNTDINNINIDENCPASGLNNAIRELMAHLKNVDTGSQALTALSVAGSVTATTSLKTPLIEFTDGDNALTIADGGNVTANADLTVSGAFTSQGIDDNADATAITIDSSERVGINVTPTAQFGHSILQVGNQATLGANKALSSTGQTYLTHNLYYDTSGTLQVYNTSSANEGALLQMVDGQLRFSNSSSTTGTPTVNRRFTIDSSGNLLVGTTDANPGNNSGGSDVGIVLDTNGKVLATANSAEVCVLNRQSSTGDILQLRKDGTTIGSLGVINGNNLRVGGSVSGHGGIQFGNNNITPMSAGSEADNAVDLGASNLRYDDIYATNSSIQTSDQQEKNTIEDSDLGLDFVKRLSPKSYIFNGKTRTHYGLIAQDVETVLSDINKPTSGFAGFVKDDISEEQDGSLYRYGLRYTEFVAPLIKAIKEQQAIIEDLQARITALENA